MSAAAATATLLDAFALTGRGTVVVLGRIEGAILMGFTARAGGLCCTVTGLEGIRFASSASFPPDTIAALVDHADTDALRALIGQRLTFHPAAAGAR